MGLLRRHALAGPDVSIPSPYRGIGNAESLCRAWPSLPARRSGTGASSPPRPRGLGRNWRRSDRWLSEWRRRSSRRSGRCGAVRCAPGQHTCSCVPPTGRHSRPLAPGVRRRGAALAGLARALGTLARTLLGGDRATAQTFRTATPGPQDTLDNGGVVVADTCAIEPRLRPPAPSAAEFRLHRSYALPDPAGRIIADYGTLLQMLRNCSVSRSDGRGCHQICPLIRATPSLRLFLSA